jgi:hypothetical protein
MQHHQAYLLAYAAVHIPAVLQQLCILRLCCLGLHFCQEACSQGGPQVSNYKYVAVFKPLSRGQPTQATPQGTWQTQQT